MNGDTELLDRARAGDREAFDALAAEHRERLARFSYLMINDAAEAEDLAQEAIAQAFEKLSTFEARSRFSSWITGIALNLCRHRLRDRKRHAKMAGASTLDRVAPRRGPRGAFSSVARRELADQIAASVARLPASMREAFVLRFIDGMEYDEIAEVTGVPAGTARVRAHRARTLLQADLARVVDSFWVESGRKPPAD